MPEPQPNDRNGVGHDSEDFRALHTIEVLQPLDDWEVEHLAERLPTLGVGRGHILFGPEHHGSLTFFCSKAGLGSTRPGKGESLP